MTWKLCKEFDKKHFSNRPTHRQISWQSDDSIYPFNFKRQCISWGFKCRAII